MARNSEKSTNGNEDPQYLIFQIKDDVVMFPFLGLPKT